MITFYCQINSPIGQLLAISDGNYLTGLYMVEHKRGLKIDITWIENNRIDVLAAAKEQLHAYFLGRLTKFQVPLKFITGTIFQQRVWQELQTIPYGSCISYAHLAARIAAVRAVRAVGAANARNPISIIIPCHRVIGTSGKLTGYAGGLERKQALLSLEQRHCRLQEPICTKELYSLSGLDQ